MLPSHLHTTVRDGHLLSNMCTHTVVKDSLPLSHMSPISFCLCFVQRLPGNPGCTCSLGGLPAASHMEHPLNQLLTENPGGRAGPSSPGETVCGSARILSVLVLESRLCVLQKN